MRQYTRPESLPPRSAHYFTVDGTYGDASDMKVFNTTQWTEQDWNDIESASDGERVGVAVSIEKRIERQMVERALKGKA